MTTMDLPSIHDKREVKATINQPIHNGRGVSAHDNKQKKNEAKWASGSRDMTYGHGRGGCVVTTKKVRNYNDFFCWHHIFGCQHLIPE
jgi:hypothetical protein